jgi:hypothetical protein
MGINPLNSAGFPPVIMIQALSDALCRAKRYSAHQPRPHPAPRSARAAFFVSVGRTASECAVSGRAVLVPGCAHAAVLVPGCARAGLCSCVVLVSVSRVASNVLPRSGLCWRWVVLVPPFVAVVRAYVGALPPCGVVLVPGCAGICRRCPTYAAASVRRDTVRGARCRSLMGRFRGVTLGATHSPAQPSAAPSVPSLSAGVPACARSELVTTCRACTCLAP